MNEHTAYLLDTALGLVDTPATNSTVNNAQVNTRSFSDFPRELRET